MLLWLALFLIIIAISFLLAYQSMRDFAEKPSALGKDYSLFLVRNPQNLSTKLLEELHAATLKTGHIITLERLFKGTKSAVVIFGPKSILDNYPDLNLLELEDYTNVSEYEVIAWEVGTKDAAMFHFDRIAVFNQIPKLEETEQFWWQLTMRGSKEHLWPTLGSSSIVQKMSDLTSEIFGLNQSKYNLINLNKLFAEKPELKSIAEQKNAQKIYQVEIRAVVVALNEKRRVQIAIQMESIDEGKLLKLPKAYTSTQILSLYKQRAKLSSNFNPLNLTVDEVLQLVIGS